jgi:hypothetical protein
MTSMPEGGEQRYRAVRLALATTGGLPSRAAVLKLRICLREASKRYSGAFSPSDDWRAALPGSRIEITNMPDEGEQAVSRGI